MQCKICQREKADSRIRFYMNHKPFNLTNYEWCKDCCARERVYRDALLQKSGCYTLCETEGNDDNW